MSDLFGRVAGGGGSGIIITTSIVFVARVGQSALGHGRSDNNVWNHSLMSSYTEPFIS